MRWSSGSAAGLASSGRGRRGSGGRTWVGRVMTKAYCPMSGSWDEWGVVMLSWISDAKGSGWHYGGWGWAIAAICAMFIYFSNCMPDGCGTNSPWFSLPMTIVFSGLWLSDCRNRTTIWDNLGARIPFGRILAWTDVRRILVEEVSFGPAPSLGITFIKRTVPEFPVERVVFAGLVGFNRKRLLRIAAEFEKLRAQHNAD